MHYLRNIIAALLALVIASPLCCCATFASQGEPTKSCCSSSTLKGNSEGNSQDKDPVACECASRQPKDTAKAIVVPGDLATLAAPHSTETVVPVLVTVETETARAIPEAGCDPPGALLVRYSRWII